MFVTRHDFTLTTDASGAATVYSSVPATGFIRQVTYVPDGSIPLTNTASVTVTAEVSTLPIITISAIGSSTATWAPRQATHSVAAATSLYAAAGTPVNDAIAIAGERIKVVVAGGGNAKTGTLYIWVD